MTRSALFNFALGLFFGVAAGAAGAVHVLTARVEVANAAATAAAEERTKELDRKWSEAFTAEHGLTQIALQRAQACEAAAGKMSADLVQRDFRDRWYTLVYEPGQPAGDAQMQIAALNLLRPGLGTMLQRVLQSPAQPGMELRFVLHGYVKPEAVPSSARLVYTLSDPPAPSTVQ